MVIGAVVLFVVTLAGVYIACRVFAYEISHLRKAGAALCFAALNIIPKPIPFISLLVPPVGLYICLMDDSYGRSTVNKVLGLTFVFAILAVLIIYAGKA